MEEHPQTQSFYRLLPRPGDSMGTSCGLLNCIDKFWSWWVAQFQGISVPGLLKISASLSKNSFAIAEREGGDCSCLVCLHFSSGLVVPLGNLPYPDQNGEFVISGNRYYVPMFVRNGNGTKVASDGNLASSLADPTANGVDDFGLCAFSPDYVPVSEQDTLLQKVEPRDTDALVFELLGDLFRDPLVQSIRVPLKSKVPDILALRSQGSFSQRDLGKIIESCLHDCFHGVLHKRILHQIGRLVNRDNPLQRLSSRAELTFYGPGGIHPESVAHWRLRDVNEKDLYKICPVQTPQGHTVGLRLYLARRAQVDLDTGTIVAPPSPAPGDSLSDAASLVPFIEHNHVARALMGCNMMKQALPLETPHVPWIRTGWEAVLGRRSEVDDSFKKDGELALGANLLVAYLLWGLDTFEDGIVVSQSATQALTSLEEKTFCFLAHPRWLEGRYESTEVTADNPILLKSEDQDKALKKLDKNGIVQLGEEVEPNDILVSAVVRQTGTVNKTDILDRLIAAAFNRDIENLRDESLRLPYNYQGKVVRITDSNNLPNPDNGGGRRIEITVRRTEPLAVGDKITGRHGNKGVVVCIIPDIEMPYIKTPGFICRNTHCPVKDSHRHIEVILNPLGVLGRMNVGQLYETALAKVAEKKNAPYSIAPFSDQWTPELLSRALEQNGLSADGKEQVYIFEREHEETLRYRSLVGPQYLLRLHHRAGDKANARGQGPAWSYTRRDNQPKGGKKNEGGQRIGEMETWALASHGAWHILDDLLTAKSDDVELRKVAGDPAFKWDNKRRPRALVNLILAFRGLGLNFQLCNEDGKDVTQHFLENARGVEFSRLKLEFARAANMEKWALNGEVLSTRLYADSKAENEGRNKDDQSARYPPHPQGLLSTLTFERHWDMGQITLASPIVHPLAARSLWKIYNPQEKVWRFLPYGWSSDLCDSISLGKGEWPEPKEIYWLRIEGLDGAGKETKIKSTKIEGYRIRNPRSKHPGRLHHPKIGMFTSFEEAAHIQQEMEKVGILTSVRRNKRELNRVRRCRQLFSTGSRTPQDYLLSFIPVLPITFRYENLDKVDSFRHDLNILYLKLMIANQRLKALIDKKAPTLIIRDGKERLFRAVNALYFGGIGINGRPLKGILQILEGKKGLIRGRLSGKRVDFSGRAVIASDSSLALDEISLPQAWWKTLSLDPPNERPVVLLNRQPSLHRYSTLAFRALHNAENVIRLSPFVCKAFNADFDGDTMAIHVPRKPQARGEMNRLLPSQNLFSQANGDFILSLGKDVALGVCFLSFHHDLESDDEVPLTDENDLWFEEGDVFKEISIKGIQTTVGRLLLRRAFGQVPIPNRTISSSNGSWTKLLGTVDRYPNAILNITENLGKLLGCALRKSGLSISIDDFGHLAEKGYGKGMPSFITLWQQAESKADLKHLVHERGQMRKPGTDQLSLPIHSGLIGGHSETEYLLSAHGARAGLIDKGLNTAEAGVFLRKLIHLLEGIYIVCDDCGTCEGLEISWQHRDRIEGRSLTEAETQTADIGTTQKGIYYRTPILCGAISNSGRSGICQKCYGQDPATGKLPCIGLPVGILAAQAIGERATQITLRTFHGGGEAKETLDLKSLSQKIFRAKDLLTKEAGDWLEWLMNRLEEHSDPPKQIHLEVILTGVRSSDPFRGGLLAQLNKSSAASRITALAAHGTEDPLWGVLSRIISGRILDTGPKYGHENITRA